MILKDFKVTLSVLLKAIDQTDIGIVISNPRLEDNPLIFVNKGFEVMTGYSSEEIVGRNCRFLQGDQTNQEGIVRLRHAIQTQQPCEVEILNYRKNGEAFWNELNITPLFDANGQLEYFVGIQKDITERKLEHEKRILFEKVFQNTQQGVIITDHASNILLVNEAFTDITGYTLEEAQGNNPKMLSSGKQSYSFYKNLWQEVQLKGQWEGEIWNKRKNGELYPEFLNISQITDDDGHVTNYVAIFNDITQSKNLEKQLTKLSSQDALTGIANRRRLDNFLLEKWLMLTDVNEPISVVLLDIDFFKFYNDHYGHQQGDRCLIRVAKVIEASVKKEVHLVARYGGEEFAVILPQIGADEAVDIAETIRQNIERENILHEYSSIAPHITVSCGVATMIPSTEVVMNVLINYADQALYQAKYNGRNRVVLFQDEAK